MLGNNFFHTYPIRFAVMLPFVNHKLVWQCNYIFSQYTQDQIDDEWIQQVDTFPRSWRIRYSCSFLLVWVKPPMRMDWCFRRFSMSGHYLTASFSGVYSLLQFEKSCQKIHNSSSSWGNKFTVDANIDVLHQYVCIDVKLW